MLLLFLRCSLLGHGAFGQFVNDDAAEYHGTDNGEFGPLKSQEGHVHHVSKNA